MRSDNHKQVLRNLLDHIGVEGTRMSEGKKRELVEYNPVELTQVFLDISDEFVWLDGQTEAEQGFTIEYPQRLPPPRYEPYFGEARDSIEPVRVTNPAGLIISQVQKELKYSSERSSDGFRVRPAPHP